MPYNNTPNLSEQEIINDALLTEKHMLHAYGTFLPEATCENLRRELNQIISETQQIQFEMFNAMRQKGWYKTKNAPLNEVENATSQYSQIKNQML